MSKRRRHRAGRTIVRRQETPPEAPQKSPEWWARQGAAQPPPRAIGGTWYGQHEPTPEEIQWFREQKEANRARDRAREAEDRKWQKEWAERRAEQIKAEQIRAEQIKAEQIKAEQIKAARIMAAQQIEIARIEAETARIKTETEQLKADKRYQPDGPGRTYGQKRKKKRRPRNPRKSSFKVAGSRIVLPTKEDLRNIARDSSIAVVGFEKPVKIHSLLTNESYHQSKLLAQADYVCNQIVETHWPTKEFSMMDWWTVPGGRLAHMYHYLSETRCHRYEQENPDL